MSGTAALVLDDSPGLNPLGVWGRILYGSTYNPPLSGLNGAPNRLLYTLYTQVSIQGPYHVTQPGNVSWTANPVGGYGTGSWSYVWYKSVNNGPFTVVGSGPTLARSIPEYGYCQNSAIKVAATQSGEPTVERTIQVTFDVPLCPE